MKSASAIAILSLLSSALAAPLEARHTAGKPFALTVTYSESDLSGPIQANGGSFWIGKQAATSCPSSVGKGCPAGTTTSFTTGTDGTLSLNSEVPGGQQVYIAPNGLLTYTVPHSADMPTGSTTSGLVIGSNNLLNEFYTYWLCNTEANSDEYNIWLQYRDVNGSTQQKGETGKNACFPVNLNAKDTTSTAAAAWEYN